MKSFKQHIKEMHGGQHNVAVDLDINPAELGNPEVVKKLNAFVGLIGNQEFILPEHALNTLRNRLAAVGIGMETAPSMSEQSGSFELQLNKMGGRFGKDENTPFDEFLNDDGISHMVEGGLKLKVDYEMVGRNNSCKLYASIV